MIDNETLTLMDQPQLEKYDDLNSAITSDYEIITTFMKINNISATWAAWKPEHPIMAYEPNNLTYQVKVGSLWCMEGLMYECCPPS